MKWISVKERLPNLNQGCLFFIKNDWNSAADTNIVSGRFERDRFVDAVEGVSFEINDVSHWMELPKKPDAGE